MPGSAPERFVITRPHADSGVGSNLASLAGALWFATRVNRPLIVDWRGSAVLKDKSQNFFAEFFETPTTLLGVRVFYAPCPELREDGDPPVELGITAARQCLTGGIVDRDVVLRAYHGLDRFAAGTEAAQRATLKTFYAGITPRPFIQREIDRFASEHFANVFVVGVNVAEGNGMFARGETYANRVDTAAWSRRGVFLRKLARARRLVTRGLAPDAQARHRIFIATDALTMRNLLLTLPNAVTRRGEFPPPGAGRFYCDYPTPEYTDRDAVVDSIADMFLLARCQALIHNFSVFNLYAQVMTDSFGGRVCQFERLFARHWVRAVRGIAVRQLTRLTRARP